MLCDKINEHLGALLAKEWVIQHKMVHHCFAMFEKYIPFAHRVALSPDFILFKPSQDARATPETHSQYLNKIAQLAIPMHDVLWLEDQTSDKLGRRDGYLVIRTTLPEEPEKVFLSCINFIYFPPRTAELMARGMGGTPDPTLPGGAVWIAMQMGFSPQDISMRVKLSEMKVYEYPIDREDGQAAHEYDKWSLTAYPIIMDIIARLNSPNITDAKESPSLDKINKKRLSKGKLPLFSYHIVDISKQLKVALRSMEGAGEPESEKRLHWVRGHFKVRKSGIFWWRPHTAGNSLLGFVDKEYVA